MSVLRNMSIKQKLTAIIMLTCIAALLLAGATFIVWEWTALRHSMAQDLSIHAEMIADNCKAALAFQDAKDAEETLRALHVQASIVFGCVYARSGKIFASYYRDDTGSMEHSAGWGVDLSELQEDGYGFGHGFLTVFKPVVLDAETIGTVCLRSDLDCMYVALKRNITVIIAVLLLASLVAYFVSSRLQRVVSEPILKLAESATKIGKGELSHRVKIQSKDELGHLATSFNDMASKLKESYTHLEQKVKERTAELASANTKLKGEIAERKQAEQELHVSTEQWQNTFNAISDSVFLLDAESKILQCNNAMAKLFGKSCSQIIGRPCWEVVHGTFEPIEECPFVQMKATKHRENIVLQMNGRWFDAVVDPLLDDSGNLIGAAHILTDITERKRAEEKLHESEERYRSLTDDVLDTSEVGIFILDKNYRILWMNQALERYFGLSREEILGKDKRQLIREQVRYIFEDSEGFAEKVLATYDNNTYIESFICHVLAEGKRRERWLEHWSQPIQSGLYIGGRIEHYTDIAERKEAEQKLEALNRDLMLTAKKLEESNRQLQDFVYIASHDLREPLRKISSFGRLLQDSLGGSLAKDDLENLDFMIDGSERMSQMIEGLLAYSRIDTQEVLFEVVDLNEIVEQLQQLELAEALEETGGTIEVPQPLPKVQSNPIQIRQLLQNLIGNAIRYHRDQVRPQIVIRAKQIDNDKVRIEVQDNGIGIEPEYHNDIFTMFRRLHSRRKYEGAGIGLAVCKKIVERHNGQIGVESKCGEGSTFWFTLSAANEAIAASKVVGATAISNLKSQI